MRQNLLHKLSGDLTAHDDALEFIRKVGDELPRKPFVVVIAGGGSQVSASLKAAGFKIEFHEAGYRVHENQESRDLATKVLWNIELALVARLPRDIRVLSPMMIIGSLMCHFNADHYLQLLAPNFDKAYCLTKTGRKKNFPSHITVMEFD